MLSIYCPRNSFIRCNIIAVYFQIWCTRFKYFFLGIELSIWHAFITLYKYKISRLRVLRWTKNFDLKYIKLINGLFTFWVDYLTICFKSRFSFQFLFFILKSFFDIVTKCLETVFSLCKEKKNVKMLHKFITRWRNV